MEEENYYRVKVSNLMPNSYDEFLTLYKEKCYGNIFGELITMKSHPKEIKLKNYSLNSFAA